MSNVKGNQCTHASCMLPAIFHLTYIVQELLPREWYCLQITGPSYIYKICRQLPRDGTPTWLTGQLDLGNSSSEAPFSRF